MGQWSRTCVQPCVVLPRTMPLPGQYLYHSSPWIGSSASPCRSDTVHSRPHVCAQLHFHTYQELRLVAAGCAPHLSRIRLQSVVTPLTRHDLSQLSQE